MRPIPTHVVVDMSDGYVYTSVPETIHPNHWMTARTSRLFANLLNSERKPGYRTFRVFRLSPINGGRRHTV